MQLPKYVLLLLLSAPLALARPNVPWDWTGIIGDGQSLSVGQQGVPVLSTNQPYNNLKLSTDDLPWPMDPADPAITLVPLVEPVGRLSHTYPSSWPDNIAGETPHTAMADEITALVRANQGRDYVTVHAAVGENGQGMIFLKKNAVPKGVNGRSYAAALTVTKAMTRLARAGGKSFGIGAIIMTHGETDAGNKDYEAELRQLLGDYNTDLRHITGQRRKILMILSQQNSCANHSPSTIAQWKVGADDPANFTCSGPKYQYPYSEGIHLIANGYRQLGEKYGQIYYQRIILGKNWRPLAPIKASRHTRAHDAEIIVRFHVPVAPLVWDTTFSPPHQAVPEWKNGNGFEITDANRKKVAIAGVAISGDTVIIRCATDPGPGATVGYAMVADGKTRMAAPWPGTYRWGLLRDSDPFVGSVTGLAQPNYAVAFEMAIR